MKISYSWLKEYVEIKLSPELLSKKLTMAGLEVTALENTAKDTVFDIEVTPNRPDCLSVIGVAREIAAITGAKLKTPKIDVEKNSKIGLDFGLKIVDKKGCLRYIGKTISDVKIGPSPVWLKKKLESVGVRPVNNIVDITNYVLLEIGQPLHAFDFDKLIGTEIIVRRAKEGEKIITIDDQERKLNPEILVIADAKKPIAIAGIMGGKDTEVTKETKNILLESAYFDSVLTRRSSRSLGLSSESSYRFERGVDKQGVSLASMRAVNLINNLAKSKLMQTKDLFIGKSKSKKTTIRLNTAEVNDLLGSSIPEAKIISILKNLGFTVSKSAKDLMVKAPSFREDVTIESDLIEEIARIYGYDNIPLSLPAVKVTDIDEQPLRKTIFLVKDILIAQGFNEAVTYSLVSEDLLQKANMNTSDLTRIVKSLSREHEILRPRLLIGLLNCMANNFNHNVDDVKIFEFGNVFKGIKEVSTLGIAISGLIYNDWSHGLQKKVTLFDLKGAVEKILSILGIKDYKFISADLPSFKKGTCAVLKIQDAEIGVLGEISDEVIDRWGIKNKQIFACELNMDAMCNSENLKKTYIPCVNFPSIKRDMSLIVDAVLPSRQIFDIIQDKGGDYLKDVILVEQYIGEQIPPGTKGLSFSLEYQAPDRTLRDEEVNIFHNNICDVLKDKLGVKIR